MKKCAWVVSMITGLMAFHTAGEQQGLFDEGFVIVTRAAKKVFLTSATEIGKLGNTSDVTRLDAQWQKVKTQYEALMKAEGR